MCTCSIRGCAPRIRGGRGLGEDKNGLYSFRYVLTPTNPSAWPWNRPKPCVAAVRPDGPVAKQTLSPTVAPHVQTFQPHGMFRGSPPKGHPQSVAGFIVRASGAHHVTCSPRAIRTLPVRTTSTTSKFRTIPIKASTLSDAPVPIMIIEFSVRSTVLHPKCSTICSTSER